MAPDTPSPSRCSSTRSRARRPRSTLTDTTTSVPSFSWTAFDSHTSAVELFRSTDGSLGTKVANPLLSATDYTDNSADSGTEYTYTVRVEGVAYVHGNDLTDYNDSTIVITAP